MFSSHLWATSQENLVQDNSQFPQQAGTSAIPHKHKALPPFPTCTERDNLRQVLFKCHDQFCMDLHSSRVKKLKANQQN